MKSIVKNRFYLGLCLLFLAIISSRLSSVSNAQTTIKQKTGWSITVDGSNGYIFDSKGKMLGSVIVSGNEVKLILK